MRLFLLCLDERIQLSTPSVRVLELLAVIADGDRFVSASSGCMVTTAENDTPTRQAISDGTPRTAI